MISHLTWGAKRIAAGHPEPFPLQYIEIGNENWGPLYNQRFETFYKAIKAKYPQLTLISNHSLKSDMSGVTGTDMIDPHWYVDPDFFFDNSHIFDTFPGGNTRYMSANMHAIRRSEEEICWQP